MADLKVRNLDDRVVVSLRAQAKRHGVSLEDEVRQILTQSVDLRRVAFLMRAAAIRASIRQIPSDPVLDSARIVREARDAWG